MIILLEYISIVVITILSLLDIYKDYKLVGKLSQFRKIQLSLLLFSFTVAIILKYISDINNQKTAAENSQLKTEVSSLSNPLFPFKFSIKIKTHKIDDSSNVKEGSINYFLQKECFIQVQISKDNPLDSNGKFDYSKPYELSFYASFKPKYPPSRDLFTNPYYLSASTRWDHDSVVALLKFDSIKYETMFDRTLKGMGDLEGNYLIIRTSIYKDSSFSLFEGIMYTDYDTYSGDFHHETIFNISENDHVTFTSDTTTEKYYIHKITHEDLFREKHKYKF